MNSTATMHSDTTVARPTTAEPPCTSSDWVEIASNPRNDSTATDSAANTRLAENCLPLKNAVADQCAPPVPLLIAITADTMNTTSTISSPIRNSRLAHAVVSMPARFTPALTTTKMTTHSHCGTPGSTVSRAAAPVT